MESAFEGNFLEALDLMHLPPDKPLEVEIASYVPPDVEEDARGRVIDKPIIGFARAHKRLILNKQNYKVCKLLHGPNTEEWIDKKVLLNARWLRFVSGSFNVPAVRVIIPDGVLVPMNLKGEFYGKPVPWTEAELKKK